MSQPTDQLTDEEIVSIIRSGETDSFGILVERYEVKMKRYARKFLFGYEDAEDIVQQVFLKAYINIKSFDRDKKFSSWLYRIAHNEFINAIRKKKREPLPFFDSDLLFPRLATKESADKEIKEEELRQIIDKCLDKVSPKYREPLVLYYFEELSYKEISTILRIPVSTVGIRILRAKKTLKSFCEKMNYHL
ncbi:MAG: RNA polymerase sigma factor [Patescibacteria group bacterium]|nr:RNA polymerase sigma factor [Patescibacteria group bacterium]